MKSSARTLAPSLFVTTALLGGSLAFTHSAHAFLGVTWSTTAPTVDGDDIYQLAVNSGGNEADNVQGGADPATYIAFDQGAQGNTFTTGSNALGYDIFSVTVKQDTSASGFSLDSGWDAFNGRFELFFGQISGGIFSHDYSFSSSLGGGIGYIGGDQAASPGFAGNTGPVGSYLTLTLDAPIHLDPNTIYGYSVYTVADQFGGPYFSSDGTNTDAFAGGNAFTEASGVATEYAGEDRVFAISVETTPVPEPQTYILTIGGLLFTMLLLRSRTQH